MTGPELKSALRDIGITQAELSRLTGDHLQTISKRCRGALDVPQYIVTIVELLRDRKKSETIAVAGD